jgi:hypothetical protein
MRAGEKVSRLRRLENKHEKKSIEEEKKSLKIKYFLIKNSVFMVRKPSGEAEKILLACLHQYVYKSTLTRV